mmetsp:Transcript_6693/g.14582  ORF Transcript_6693/g.14582 Transcript_6693/m.14582 type:complete len:264 (-) Transcript_6693:137-928(-)
MQTVVATVAAACVFEPVIRQASLPSVLLYNHASTQVPYTRALSWQRELLASRVQCVREKSRPLPDALLLMQHEPVFTLGTASDLTNLLTSPPPFNVVRTERGGEVTYHGPGQLVLYPILDLRSYQQDVHWYMRALEEVVIRTLGTFGLCGERVPGLTGVWVNGAKVSALGVKISRWVTMHGIAINVCPDMAHWQHIVPCGIADKPVTSLAELLPAADIEIPTVQHIVLRHFCDVFGVKLSPVPHSLPANDQYASRAVAGQLML